MAKGGTCHVYDAGVDLFFLSYFTHFCQWWETASHVYGHREDRKGIIKSIMGGIGHQRGWTTVDCRPRENGADKRRLYPYPSVLRSEAYCIKWSLQGRLRFSTNDETFGPLEEPGRTN